MQYIRILTEWEPEKDIADRDYVKLLSILVGKSFAGMENTIENEITLIDAIGWVVFSPFTFSTELPKVLQIGTQVVDIPPHPKQLSIEQNIHLRRRMEKSNTLEENIAMATAIFLQPNIDGKKFSIERVNQICTQIEEMPVYLVYPVGFFFLQSVLNYGRNSGKTWSLGSFNLKPMLRRLLPKWHASKN